MSETPPEGSDYFSLFGFAQHPDIDLSSLEARYYDLARHYHPDFHHKKSKEEREATLRFTALLTTAYRTLKDPVERGRYWLELRGEKLSRDNIRVPSDVAEKAFEIFDILHRLKSHPPQDRSHLVDALRTSRMKLDTLMKENMERLRDNFLRWPSPGTPSEDSSLLSELKDILSRISYLSSLRRDMDNAAGAPETLL